MAVKERKQITGTTAQINAYEGHEGQIVWDKDKKTLVGMSGTAGKNYPLAPKTYVDNEISKVNTEVAKKASSAELTQGLAGKEDKGTCLPKTGGTLLGGYVNLQSRDGNATTQILRSDYESEFEGVDIPTEISNWDLGAVLSLRANSCATKDEAGSFHIRTGTNPTTYFFRGQPDGHLTWAGKEIERVALINAGGVIYPENSHQSYIRFDSGLQIICGTAKVNGLITEQKRVNYIVPFTIVARVIAGSDANVGLIRNVGVGWQTVTGFSIGSDHDSSNGWCNWIAIGFWK